MAAYDISDLDMDYDGDLPVAERFIRDIFGDSPDLRVRPLRMGQTGPDAALLYLNGLIDRQVTDQHILKPLIDMGGKVSANLEQAARTVAYELTSDMEVTITRSIRDLMYAVSDGGVILLMRGCPEAVIFQPTSMQHRGITKSETEHAVRGAREGFSELLSINLSMIRRRSRDPNLRVKQVKVGKRSRTRVGVVWVDGLTNQTLVESVLQRIQAIDIDNVQESHVIEVFLGDHPYTPFPLLRSTERPDEAVRVLYEGKVLVLTDNTPFVLTAPAVFMDFYQTMEDYNFNFWGVSLIRLLRFIGWSIALFAPGMYISLIAINPEMLPNELTLTIVSAREGLPFPPIIEVFIMEILIELVREAGLRLPQPLGSTIGIVGGVVIGQAIVVAGIISPLMIVVGAVTLLASFTTPVLDMGFPWRILKWVLIFLGNMFGLVGVILGASAILGHLVSLNSFGVPYLTPMSPVRPVGMKDTLLRGPLHSLRKRSTHPSGQDETKIGQVDQPAPHPSLTKSALTPEEDEL